MNTEAKKKAKELLEWFCKTISNDKNAPTKLLLKLAKQCALKVAKSEWEVLEEARVFEQHDFYLELFEEIENYG